MKTTIATSVFVILFAAGSGIAQQSSPDALRSEFGLKSFQQYQQDFVTANATVYQTDQAPVGDAGPGWYDYWKSALMNSASGDQTASVANLRYYLRLNSQLVTDANYTDFDNVKRVMRIMPQAKFEAMFPYSTSNSTLAVTDMAGSNYLTVNATIDAATATVCWEASDTSTLQRKQYFSYENFLKAVALLPGFCGDYTDYPDKQIAQQLQPNADLIARKFLASVFAHAVQETSNSGQGDLPTMMQKIPGTFANIVEVNGSLYPDKTGIFRISGTDINDKGPLYPLTLTGGNATVQGATKPVSHSYCGRGIKQTSYPTNYANASMFLFGDLRLLAYPELIEEPGVMGFLSGLVYAMIPKDSNPSIFEVMDGTFHSRLQALSANSTISGNSTFNDFKSTYDLEFPLTVLLVNGGPECDMNAGIDANPDLTPAQKQDLKNSINNNTKIRVEAYNYFVLTTDLLNHAQVAGQDALPPALAAEDAGSTSGAQYLPASAGTVANEHYNLSGNLTSCLNLRVGAVNAINSSNPWQMMFKRLVYFGPNTKWTWNAATNSSDQTQVLEPQFASGTNLPIFGGSPVYTVMATAYPSIDSDGDTLTDKVELLTYGSNPTAASTQNDGLTDGAKVAIGLSPAVNFTAAITTLRAQGRAAVIANPSSYGLVSTYFNLPWQFGGMFFSNEMLADVSEWFDSLPGHPLPVAGYQPKGSANLLGHLHYTASLRDQTPTGTCWIWSHTAAMSIDFDTQFGGSPLIQEGLSVQFLASNAWMVGSDLNKGGHSGLVKDFYERIGYAIPSKNTCAMWNAVWNPADQTWEWDESKGIRPAMFVRSGTPWAPETEQTNYPIKQIDLDVIKTFSTANATVTQQQAIERIKAVLDSGCPVPMMYTLPTAADWRTFDDFWAAQTEPVATSFDYAKGHVWENGGGCAHWVLCVGYDDSGASPSWLILNSHYAGDNRPNNIFRIAQQIDYNATFDGGDYPTNRIYNWVYFHTTFADKNTKAPNKMGLKSLSVSTSNASKNDIDCILVNSAVFSGNVTAISSASLTVNYKTYACDNSTGRWKQSGPLWQFKSLQKSHPAITVTVDTRKKCWSASVLNADLSRAVNVGDGLACKLEYKESDSDPVYKSLGGAAAVYDMLPARASATIKGP